MNHSFTPSLTDIAKCARCKHDELAHTDRATCECCSNSGTMEVYSGMLMCADCLAKEKALQADHFTPEKQAERVAAVNANVIQRSRELDSQIELSSDLFNAETVAIVEITAAVVADESVPAEQKNFRIAELLIERHEKLQSVIFDARKSLVDAQNKQRALITHLNTLSNKLRIDERERLKLKDISYRPETPKKPKVASNPKSKGKRFNLAEVKKFALEYDVPEAMIQIIATRNNLSAEDAAKFAHKKLND